VIVAPAFTSVGVTLVINGCDEGGSVEFVQPAGRITANHTTTDKMQLIVFDGMAFPPSKVSCTKCDGNHRNSNKIIEERTAHVKGGMGYFRGIVVSCTKVQNNGFLR